MINDLILKYIPIETIKLEYKYEAKGRIELECVDNFTNWYNCLNKIRSQHPHVENIYNSSIPSFDDFKNKDFKRFKQYRKGFDFSNSIFHVPTNNEFMKLKKYEKIDVIGWKNMCFCISRVFP